jgi:glycosyltransferase involved in cell wall biosynthesis
VNPFSFLRQPALSIVVPCFNEEANLSALTQRVEAVCEAVAPGAYEIILVNDGSRDRTWAGICALADRADHITGVNLSRNYGHQLALSAGLSICKGDAVLILDADLQDPPELLPAMIDKMREGYDVLSMGSASAVPVRRCSSAPPPACSTAFWIGLSMSISRQTPGISV